MSSTRRLLPLLALLAGLGLLAAGCGGGGGGVPKDAIARVGGATIPRTALEEQLAIARRVQKKSFPKAGQPEYFQLQNQLVQALVDKSELEQKADELGVEVTDKQVTDAVRQFKEQQLGGSEKRYLDQLRELGMTQDQARDFFRYQLLRTALFDHVTANVEVSDKEVAAYYGEHRADYAHAQTRQVAHVLVKTRALADSIYRQATAGADFSALAKKYSIDTGTASLGGLYTVERGKTQPPFEQAAFELRTGQVSQPVKTVYGWHVIKALGPVLPPKRSTLAQVKESIRATLLDQKRKQEFAAWGDRVAKDFAGKTSFAPGYAPPSATATQTTTG